MTVGKETSLSFVSPGQGWSRAVAIRSPGAQTAPAEQGRKLQQLGLSYKYSLGMLVILGMFAGNRWLLKPTPGASMNRECLTLNFSGWFGSRV